MAQRCYLRAAAGHKYNMERSKEESPRQDDSRWKETVVALCPPWDEVE